MGNIQDQLKQWENKFKTVSEDDTPQLFVEFTEWCDLHKTEILYNFKTFSQYIRVLEEDYSNIQRKIKRSMNHLGNETFVNMVSVIRFERE